MTEIGSAEWLKKAKEEEDAERLTGKQDELEYIGYEVCDGKIKYHVFNTKHKVLHVIKGFPKSEDIKQLTPDGAFEYWTSRSVEELSELGFLNKSGSLNNPRIGEYIVKMCFDEGVSDKNKHKNTGVFKSGDKIIISTPGYVYNENAQKLKHKIDDRFYLSKDNTFYKPLIDEPYNCRGIILDYCDFLANCTWGVDPLAAAQILTSWTGLAMVGGALDFKPQISISGGSGGGKSSLLSLTQKILGDFAFPGFTKGTTWAGFKNCVTGSSKAIIFDEAELEPGDNGVSAKNLNQIWGGLRTANSSGFDANICQASDSKGGFSWFEIDSCSLIAGIQPPMHNEADILRFLELKVNGEKKDEKQIARFYKGLRKIDCKSVREALWYITLSRLRIFFESYYKNLKSTEANKLEGHRKKAYATIKAYQEDVLGSPFTNTNLFEIERSKDAQGKDISSRTEECLQILLNHHHFAAKKNIYNMIKSDCHKDDLALMGLKTIDEEYLFIANKNSYLSSQVYKNTIYEKNAWNNYLPKIKHPTRKPRVYLLGTNPSGVFIKIPQN